MCIYISDLIFQLSAYALVLHLLKLYLEESISGSMLIKLNKIPKATNCILRRSRSHALSQMPGQC